jgi:GT2 family glycosyltransferase
MPKPLELIGTMVLNGAADLLSQHASIDFPVKRYFIIDNSGGKYPEVTKALEKIKNEPSPYIKELVVQTNYKNVGFSGSVNQIIKQNVDKPYWFIMSVDWHPEAGQLEIAANRLEKPFDALMFDPTQNGYSSMVWTPLLIYHTGLMDENFFPAYYEDNDHRYRMALSNIDWEYLRLSFKHKVSSTLKSDQSFIEKNQYTFKENLAYYVKKWGGPPGSEKFKSPFNLGGALDYAPYDPIRIKHHQWD